MSSPEALQLRVRSNPEEFCAVRDRLEAWVLGLGWSQRETDDITLAVDEALTNIVRHGYQCARDQTIELSAEARRDPAHGDCVRISLRDFGRQVDPTTIRGRDLEKVRPGGLGVHIIQSIMDEVTWTPAGGGGMRLDMQKYRSASSHQS